MFPRRGTVRWRFTALYVGLFLLSGTALLALAGLLAARSTRVSEAVPGTVPDLGPAAGPALARIEQLQQEVSRLQDTRADQLLLGSAVALAVMAVVSVVLGWYVAGRVLRPLRAMTAATRRITADNLHERLAADGPADELKDLSDTIDGLLERLEGSFAAQRRFVADASHELRTPLATIRASLDVAVGKPAPVAATTLTLAGRVRTELDRVEQLLESFLMLARAEHRALPDTGRLSLRAVAARALAARAADLGAGRLTVLDGGTDDAAPAAGTDACAPHAARAAAASGPAGREAAAVLGSPTLLTRMVENLVDNAIRHNHEGGWIRVTTDEDGATVRLTVESGGAVLDPGQVARLAQPFRRLGAARTGTDGGSGLGLSIVAAVAAAHGGGLDLHARPAGGLRATVRLPAAGAAASGAAPVATPLADRPGGGPS
ncbi:sensor histidine kinase [Kitasatospora indigofera]|uniref:sensor histidine kinase n=2 Tax=Kitasatospora indigofera TaxID=67307 RepID=UPI00363EA677